MTKMGYVDVVGNDVIKFEGEIKRFIFRKDDFVIGHIMTDKKQVTFKGNLYGVEEDEKIILYGKWESHPKFGDQISVDSWERPVPTTKEHTIEFLSSGLVKGVGKARAKRIVDKLGDNAITIIKDKGVEALLGIKGIGKATASDIFDSIVETFEIQEIVKRLARFGISANVCMKLYKEYGSDTVKVIMKNPYVLTSIERVGFTKADEVAKSIGIKPTSSFRINACIVYVLDELCYQGGHTFIEQDSLIQETMKMLNTNVQNQDDFVQYSEVENSLYGLEDKDVMFEKTKVYSKRMYTYETYVARKISILLNNRGGEALPKIENALKRYQSRNSIILAEKQREAVYQLLQENVMIITGKPGTGKTTTLRAMLDVYEELYPKHKILLSAPTGRASRKMSESTGRDAFTVHSMLGYRQGNIPEFNEDNPLEADVVVLDEWSMADLNLTYWLLSAIEKGTKVVFIGDVDQLPSVSPGNVLSDFIEANLPTIRLEQIFRQAEESQIIQNAHRINEGKNLLIDDSKDDFYFIQQYNNQAIAQLIIKSALRFIQLGYSLEDLLILSPMRSGDVGINVLNEMLRQAINPYNALKNEIKVGERFFREGDKVMQNVNNTDKDVYNGELGVIKSIMRVMNDKGKEKDVVICDFDGEEKSYNRDELIELELGYALTIHKSQGGEAPIVVMPITMSHKIMLARNLYYTGITRAKEKVVLIGTDDAMKYAISNNKMALRNSMLDVRTEHEVTKLRQLMDNKVEEGTS